MTNGEKYKTVEERTMAFRKFCANKMCKGHKADCVFSDKLHDKTKHMCEFAWLELEYEEELKPCPFCGGEARLISNSKKDHYAICRNNDCAAAIIARSFASAKDAIAAWNWRAK